MASILKILHSRVGRVAILLFQAFWLNVVVPGHQRGVVMLPGAECASCRLALAASCHHASDPGPAPKSAPGDPASHCAICHFAAMLSLPPVIDLTPPVLEFLEFQPPPVSQRLVSLPFPATYDGRAPPAMNSQSA